MHPTDEAPPIRCACCTEYRWANERRIHAMPTPEELEQEGYVRVKRHPNYETSWLMVRQGPAAP